MLNIDFDECRVLLINSDFESRNAKVTGFWNTALNSVKIYFSGRRTAGIFPEYIVKKREFKKRDFVDL
ncbi:hypothetical protein A9239_04665 [Methanosarcina sp. A14]|uniref:Uncharacterized protein n=2 Tax=Methanosarcina barkeri TaxID=2208 RepID=A0A0E3QTH3_METBA|nr:MULTISPECIES: hypothetical protein [Methanosarcina]AKB54247.1 hypothetical protein MSBRM_1249 [Methanosarcina barkeri MS]AKJ38222.1 hypothetical protein MCM1_1166 [Methanosarcina barkeri CM1]OEC90428.1 hypothetical protein A9239_04665 [Methanosarcina sp. A14]